MAYGGLVGFGDAKVRLNSLSSKETKNDEKLRASPKKKKIKSPEEEALQIMADARKKHIKEIKEKLDIKNRDYQEKLKTIAVLKKTKESLLEEYLLLNKENKGKLVDEYRKVITQLKLSELITAVDIDSEKRLIFTTTAVIVKKKKWKHARLAGIYQIRIDFSKTDYSSAIRVLNITQRKDGYDHPHISDTNPCWGNIRNDIKKDFDDKNVYELIVDITDYLKSDADGDGWLQFEGSDEELEKEFGKDEKEEFATAWESFLSKAKKMPAGYSFARYEQEKEEKKLQPVVEGTAGGSGSIGYDFITTNSVISATSNIAYGSGGWVYMNEQTLPISPYRNRRPVSYYEAEMEKILEDLGFTEKAAWHFVEYIKPSKDRFITHLELVDRGDSYWLMIHTTQPQPVTAMEINEMSFSTVVPRDIERIFVNKKDIKPAVLTDMDRQAMSMDRTKAVQVSFALNERYIDEEEQLEQEQHRKEVLAMQMNQLASLSPHDVLREVTEEYSTTQKPEDEPSEPKNQPIEGSAERYGLVQKPKETERKREDKKKTLSFGDFLKAV